MTILMEKLLAWSLALFFPGVILLAVVGFNIYTAIEWNRANHLQQAGAITQGEITSLDQTSSLKTPTTYLITYRYTVASNDYIMKRQVDEGLYRRLNVNQTVPIVYLIDQPAKSDLSGNQVRQRLLLLAISLDIALAGFVFSVIRSAKNS
jgi:hypothetical protein